MPERPRRIEGFKVRSGTVSPRDFVLDLPNEARAAVEIFKTNPTIKALLGAS